jgi:hypothetical protein
MAAGVVTLATPRAEGIEEMLDRQRRTKPIVESHGARYTVLSCISGGTMTGMTAIGIWGESLTALGKSLDSLGQDPAWLGIRTELAKNPPGQTLGTRIMADVAGFDTSMPEHTAGMVMGYTTWMPGPNQTASLMGYFTDAVELFRKAGFPARVRRALYSGAPVSYQLASFYKGGIGEALANWDSNVLSDPQWQALVRRNHEAGIVQSSQSMFRPVPLP